MEKITYWNSRAKTVVKSYKRFFRNSFLTTNPITLLFFSIRLGTHVFLSRQLAALRSKTKTVSVLDIGCGWGQDLARIPQVSMYGVDIHGFPREHALRKGYADAAEYGENGEIPYPADMFDSAMILNVNAHISDELFGRLLNEAGRVVKEHGTLFIVAECDNESLSKKIFTCISKDRFKKLVTGMDHTNYKFEKRFDDLLRSKNIEIRSKTTVMGQFLPFIHYWTFTFNSSPYRSLRYLSIAADIVISVLDNIATVITPKMQGKRFLIGYVCTFAGKKQS